MERAFYLQIYPTLKQERSLRRHCIATRILYNETICEWQTRYFRAKAFKFFVGKSPYQYKKELVNNGNNFYLKNIIINAEGKENKIIQTRTDPTYTDFNNKFPWMQELSSLVRREAVKDANDAFKKFFKGLSKYPKFKKRNHPLQCRNEQGSSIKLIGDPYVHTVIVPGIGDIKLSRNNFVPSQKEYRKIYKGKEIISTNIIQVAFKQLASKWFISISMHLPEIEKPVLKPTVIGMDAGCRTLAAIANPDKSISNEYKLTNAQKEKLDWLEIKLKRWNKTKSRRHKKGQKEQSKGWYEAKSKIEEINLQITQLREDIMHKITSRIADQLPERLVVENLSIKNMLKNKKLAPTLSKVGLYKTKQCLVYKSKANGTKVFEASRNYPSTQTCPSCGVVKGKNGLKKQGSKKIYHCEVCGFHGDRDKDVAAVNLAKAPEAILTEI